MNANRTRRDAAAQLIDGDMGLVLAMYRHEGIDVAPPTEADIWPTPAKPLAWKCNQGRGPEEHVSRVPPSWFGRPGRGPVGDVEPRDKFDGRATIAVWVVAAVFWVVIVSAVIQVGPK